MTMRTVLFLAALALAGAVIQSHMTLPIELGVNQMRQNVETDIVTFYAVVRDTENSEYRWILSFVNFTCDGTCAESTSNFCESTPRLNPGWESHPSAYYPHEGDPPAIHIQRSMEIDGEMGCEDGLEWSYDDASSIAQLNGQLYLHTIRGCNENGCPVLVSSDVLPFQLSYNTESGELNGLQARDMSYVYSIVSTKNLWLSGYDSLVELTSNVQSLGDINSVAVPIRFENPTIASQSMSPTMKIVGLTDCASSRNEPGCFQNWYIQAQSGFSAPTPIGGQMEIVADLIFNDGSIVQSLLHLDIDVQTAYDPSQTPRLVDSLTSIQGKPYFSDMLNPENVKEGDRICIALSSPDRASLEPGAVRICASQKVDLIAGVSSVLGCRTPDVDDMAIYQIMDIATGFYNSSFNPTLEQSFERPHEYRVCFNAVPLSDRAEVIEVYYSRTEVIDESEDVEETSRRRQVGLGDMYVSQSVPIGCAWSESWDPVLCRCIPYTTVWDNDDWTWLWVVFLVIFFIFIVGSAAFICCYAPSYDTCAYPIRYSECGHTYMIYKNKDGSTTKSVVVEGDDNIVYYDSPETERASRTQKSKKK